MSYNNKPKKESPDWSFVIPVSAQNSSEKSYTVMLKESYGQRHFIQIVVVDKSGEVPKYLWAKASAAELMFILAGRNNLTKEQLQWTAENEETRITIDIDSFSILFEDKESDSPVTILDIAISSESSKDEEVRAGGFVTQMLMFLGSYLTERSKPTYFGRKYPWSEHKKADMKNAKLAKQEQEENYDYTKAPL